MIWILVDYTVTFLLYMVEQNGLHIDVSEYLVYANGNANIVNFILLILDRDAHTEFRNLCTPYSSYSVLVKIAVPRAKICTPGVRYSSYSVLPVLGAENIDRAAY